jgi:hypothetical protein
MQFLSGKTFGMSKGGKEYRRLVAAFERTFGATIFFGTDSLTANAKVVHRARFNFFRLEKIHRIRGPCRRTARLLRFRKLAVCIHGYERHAA